MPDSRDEAIEASLTIERGEGVVAGSLRGPHGPPRRFEGLLELLAAVQRLAQDDDDPRRT